MHDRDAFSGYLKVPFRVLSIGRIELMLKELMLKKLMLKEQADAELADAH